jgi:hypothetical protein
VLIALGSLVLLGLLLLLGLLAWLRAADTSNEGPIVVDPAAVLAEAQGVLDEIKSVKYEAEAGFFGIDTSGTSVTATRPLTVAIQGEIELPDKYTLSSPVPQLGNYVVIGDTTWHRINAGDAWDEQDTSNMSLGLINPLTFFSLLRYHKPGTAAVHIGSEKRGDTIVHRIRFEVDTDRMALEMGDPSTRSILATSSVDVDAWIEDKTHFVESMAVSVESDDGTGIILRTDFSDYNLPVDIRPPE